MMKTLVLLSAVVALSLARTLEDDVASFSDFRATFGRQYSPSEEAHRFSCFRKTLDQIEARNALGAETHGINQFTDMCADEFKATHHNLAIPANYTSTAEMITFSAAEAAKLGAGSVDWRTKGAVTHVKNQGMCGSCWSFSSTGNMEGQWKLAGNTLVGLSEQELVSCSHNGNMGCNGGLMDNAFKWVIQNGGIDSEGDYPYTSGGGSSGSCENSKLSKDVAKFSSYKDITKTEAGIAAFVATSGPAAIAVDAASGWQTYSGGIMKTCFGRQLDHGVLAVGYGTSGSTEYWIVKNSWGASWGENGYIRLERGTNQCGLNQMPSTIKA